MYTIPHFVYGTKTYLSLFGMSNIQPVRLGSIFFLLFPVSKIDWKTRRMTSANAQADWPLCISFFSPAKTLNIANYRQNEWTPPFFFPLKVGPDAPLRLLFFSPAHLSNEERLGCKVDFCIKG